MAAKHGKHPAHLSQNFNQTSERMDRITRELKDTGIIEDAKGLVSVAKSKIESFGGAEEGSISGKDLKEMATTFKEEIASNKVSTQPLSSIFPD
jgi:hypothetical protein